MVSTYLTIKNLIVLLTFISNFSNRSRLSLFTNVVSSPNSITSRVAFWVQQMCSPISNSMVQDTVNIRFTALCFWSFWILNFCMGFTVVFECNRRFNNRVMTQISIHINSARRVQPWVQEQYYCTKNIPNWLCNDSAFIG